MAKRLGEKEIFKTKLFTIKDIDLEFTTGKNATYQILHKNNTALIVPVTKEGKFVLVKEYYAAIDEYGLSFPKGRIEKGENKLDTANKELQEEIGYKAKELNEIALFTMSPGYITQKTHVFMATDLRESKLKGDEEEELEILEVSFDEFEKLVKDGKITEARTIAAFYLVNRILKNKK